MRILMLNYEFPPVGGGGATINYYLAREMVRLGHDVTILTSATAGLPLRETVEGIDVRRVRILRRRLDYASFHEMLQYVILGTPHAIRLARAKPRWDIVQTFFAVPSGLVGCWAARACGAPQVVSLWGGDLPGHEKRFGLLHRLMHPIVGRVLRKVPARVVNSQGLCDRAVSIFPKLDFAVIPNGIDRDLFHPPDQPHDGVPTVLFVSRLIERKGLHLLLTALGTLLQEGVEFRVLVIGDGPMREKLEEQTAALALTDRTTFLGLIDHGRLPELYRQGDIFCLPSASEGMASVVLEALATGLPIVTTDVPGTSELVTDGYNGFVGPIGDADALVDPLRRLLTDREFRREQGLRSRERSADFSWTVMAERYLALYASLIDGARAKRSNDSAV